MSLLFGIFGFCISIAYNFVPLLGYDKDAFDYLMVTTSNEIIPLLISSGCFIFIATFLCYNIGDIFSEKLSLNKNKMDKKSWIYIGIVGVIVPILIGLMDTLLYMGEEFISIYYTLVNVPTSILYYGVVEEIWLRFAFLPFIIYTFYYVANRKNKNKKEGEIDKKYYILGLVFTALFLFVFEFNKIASMYSLNLLLLIRIIFVYLVPNYIYGHLYVKYNIKVSVLAHSIFILMHLGVVPFVMTLV